MSVFRSKLARFNTICCQQVNPVSVIPIQTILNRKAPNEMYPLPLPFAPEPSPVCEPAVIPIQVGVYPPPTEPPIGSILVNSSGGLAPTNYLTCDGSEVSRTIYHALFNVIGTYYGEGDQSTTFNLPLLSNDCNPNLTYIIKYDNSLI